MPIMKTTVLALLVFAPTLLAAQADDLSGIGDAPRTVSVSRWVSPVVGDFVSIPDNHATEAQMKSWGYTGKIYQYDAWLTSPGAGAVAVYRWTMPNGKEFILLAAHEHTDAELESWGYRDKKFVFYAYKTRPNRSYVAVNRWVNALPQGNSCRDYTLSVLETELTDEQLTSWGYSGKKTQFYVFRQ